MGLCTKEGVGGHLVRLWVKGKLDVTLSNNSEMADGLDGDGAQPVVVRVCQRLRWSDHYGLCCVYTQWVDVLHVTHLIMRSHEVT